MSKQAANYNEPRPSAEHRNHHDLHLKVHVWCNRHQRPERWSCHMSAVWARGPWWHAVHAVPIIKPWVGSTSSWKNTAFKAGDKRVLENRQSQPVPRHQRRQEAVLQEDSLQLQWQWRHSESVAWTTGHHGPQAHTADMRQLHLSAQQAKNNFFADFESHNTTRAQALYPDTICWYCPQTLWGNVNRVETNYRSEVSRLVIWCSDNNLSLKVAKTEEIIVVFVDPASLHFQPQTEAQTAYWYFVLRLHLTVILQICLSLYVNICFLFVCVL